MRKLYFSTLLLFVSYLSFAQNYTVLGSATPNFANGCNCYRLTPDANDQAGAIFQSNTIDLNNSFDFSFEVFLGCNNGNDAADGIVFVLTNNPNGLGSGGGGLGYGGSNQPYSIGVEFDTWENAGDPSYDHIGIQSGGLMSHNVAAAVPALTNSGNVDNCQPYPVRIVWNVNTNTFQVYFNGVLRQSVVIPNMVNSYFGGNPIVNWGWTGGTGGGTNEQGVCVLNTSNWVAGVNYQSCSTTMQFSDVSTSSLGSVQSWAWTFGDGGTSNQQNPTHTYAAPGTYNVSLTVTDITNCANTFSHPVTINPPITLTPTIVQPLCNGGSNGSVSVAPTGGFGPAAGYGGFTYSWNGGVNVQQTYAGIPAGTYAVTVTDGVCTTTASYLLDQPTALTAVITHTDANCNTNNGTATLTPSGGTPPYSFQWPNGATTSTATGLAPGIYIPNFLDANNCSSLLQYSTTVNSLPCGYNLSTSGTDVSCFGGNNGSATVTVTGAGVTNPVNISWTRNGTPVGNTATINGLIAGAYVYNWSDGSGQTFTGTVTVNQPGAAMVASMTTLNTSCAGTNDGQALASVSSGGDSPYSYVWSPAQPNAASVSGLAAGNYSVTIIDSKSCTASASGVVTGPPTLTLSITSVNDSCYQSNTGSATANAGGGTPPYTYYWSNISSAQTNLSLGAGTYNVTVTDDNGCTIGGTATITEPPAFTHTIASQNIACSGSNTGSISVTPQGGTPAYTYTWNPASATGANPTNLTAGQYYVTITDNMGCQRTDSATITQPATPLSVVMSHTDVRCFGGSDGTVTFTVSGGTPPYTYMGNPIPPGTTTLTNVPPSTYTGNLTDANGCTFAINETVGQPQPQSLNVSGTNNLCNGASTGSATANFVNATGAVTYVWSNTAQTGATISNLTANTYNVTATDANTCTLTGSYTVTEPAAPVMTVGVVDATCFGGNGTATAQPSGGGSFTYVWSGTTATTVSVNLPAGSYTVTATDASQCNQTAAFTIIEPAGMTIGEQHTDVACHGDSTGLIQLNVIGGTGPNYTYAWNPNVSNSSLATALWAATYSITVTDQANCTQTTSVTIAEPAQALTLGIQSTNVPCFGQNNGSITLTVTGGTPNYTYTWNPSVSTTNTASNLSPGNYSITVTDANGCSVMPIITISEPSQALTVVDTQTNLTCYQSADGVAAVAVTGGTAPYTYVWSGTASTNNTATGLSANTPYSVTVTDFNQCTNTSTFTLTEPALLTASALATNLQCNGDATGEVDVTANGGTPGYTYNWNPAVSTTNTATGLNAGAYSIIVTDTNGCTVTTSATVSEPAALQATATVANVTCNALSNGAITVTTTGGTTPYTWQATDGTNNYNGVNGQFNNIPAGTYAILVTDQNACTTTVSATVTEPNALVLLIDTTPATCYNYTDGSVVVTPTGGTPSFNFSFSNGEQNSSGVIGGLAAGVYSFTVTDANACQTVDSAVITEPDTVLISVSPTPTTIELGQSLQLTTTHNQLGTVSYDWQPSFGLSCTSCDNPIFEGVYSQTYNVAAITNAGCRGTAEFVVTVTPDYDIFFPNAFTPNGDGMNDYWQFYTGSNAIKQIQVQVFNRIGEKVFEGNDIGFKWFGDYKGVNAPPGVYTYVAKIVWLNNENDNGYHGTITLIR